MGKRMRKRKIAGFVIGFLVLILGVRVVFAFTRFSMIQRSFGSIAVGESRRAVVHELGMPNYHAGDCGLIGSPPPQCVLEYVYSNPMAPMAPDYYVVSFSSDEQVIGTIHLQSP
jgi:hypothetical protein